MVWRFDAPLQRSGELMSDKLKVLITVAGGHRLERSLHARFARYRVKGEWFRHEGELAEYIQSLRKQDNR